MYHKPKYMHLLGSYDLFSYRHNVLYGIVLCHQEEPRKWLWKLEVRYWYPVKVYARLLQSYTNVENLE